MKLRLVAGTINDYQAEPGWRNYSLDASARPVWDEVLGMGVQPDFVMDIASMPDFRPEMFDEVRLHHVLEHLTRKQGVHAVRELCRVLKPGGVLDIEVPDLDRLCEAWIARRFEPHELCQWFYSEDVDMPDAHLNAHRYGYNEETLSALLSDNGFDTGARLETGLAVRFRAVKR